MEDIVIRKIEAQDNAALAKIIRQTLEEFNAAKPGTVYYDESTDRLSTVFIVTGSIYYVAEQDGVILGGAGIYPTDGLDKDTCELVKMYLLPSARGKGTGIKLLSQCIAFATQAGYKNIYIESMPELKKAVQLYKKLGFERLKAPIGKGGHFGCDIWMMKQI